MTHNRSIMNNIIIIDPVVLTQANLLRKYILTTVCRLRCTHHLEVLVFCRCDCNANQHYYKVPASNSFMFVVCAASRLDRK